ncbi:MAG: hypothetical protein ACRCUS_00275 [Anaerovoracaceae bacterium]
MNIDEKFLEDMFLRINKIEYKVIDDSCEDFEMLVKDDYRIEQIDDEGVEIIISRRIRFKPECIFDLLVEVGFRRNFSEGNTIKEKDINKDTIDEICDSGYARISSVISAITAATGAAPVVTPPYFEEESR